MRTVVLDANALVMPFQFPVNLDAELERLLGTYEIVLPTSVVRELEGLARTDRKARGAARLASRYPTIETEAAGDEAVIEAAERLDAVVVTNDDRLLAKLRQRGVPRIRLRSRSHLILEEPP